MAAAKASDEAILAAFAAGYSRRETATMFGMSERRLFDRVKAMKQKAKLNADGSIPGRHPIPGMEINKVSIRLDPKGKPKSFNISQIPIRAGNEHVDPNSLEGGRRVRLSTYTGADGEITGQWDIRVFDDKEENYIAAKLAMLEDIAPLPPISLRPSLQHHSSLVNTIVLSDCHIGGLTWKPETGGDWDLKIAEEMLVDAFRVMIQESPDAETCFISLLGDWLHYDLPDPLTTLSGNILSADGRREKMIDVAIRIAKKIITEALARYPRVLLLVAEGNHDIVSAIWLRKLFAERFAENPRLEVIQNPLPFYAWRFGDVMLGWHHGHMKAVGNKKSVAIKNAEQLVAIFADEFATIWGRTTKRYIHTGHLHTKIELEPRGAQVIQHPTLASRDDHAARHGWASLRNALCITYHEKFGERRREVISPELVAHMKGIL
mgnify:CR=1 FL=1